jgi:hypothetical protein
MVESTAKLREEIMALSGVDIMEADGKTFKSTYQILDELAKKWKDLTDIQQASITELIAGKRQGNIVSSLMSNFQTARDALETSMNSSGSAMEEHAKWSESIEAHLNRLKASWQSFAQTFMDSDTLKAGIDALSGLLNIIEKLIDNFGLLGTIGIGVFAKNILGYYKQIRAASAANIASDTAEAAASEQAAAAEYKEAQANQISTATENQETAANTASAASEVNEAAANTAVTATENQETIASQKSAMAEYIETAANTASAASEMNEALANTGNAASEATKGLKGFFGTIGGKIAIIGMLVAGISLIYNGIKQSKEEASQLRQETIQASNEFLDASKSFEQAYIKYSGKTDLTAEEEEDLTSAIQGTVSALGDKSGALKDVVNSSNDYLYSLERIKDEELRAAKRAAKDKRDAAEGELKEAAIGWSNLDGSEVNVASLSGEAANIAQSMGSKFLTTTYVQAGQRENEAVINFSLSGEADTNEIVEYYYTLLDYQERLEDAGLDDTSTYDNVSKSIEEMSGAIDAYISGVHEAAKAQYQMDNGIPKTLEEYLKMREAILNDDEIKNKGFGAKLSISNMLDSEYNQLFDLSSVEAQARKFVGIIKGYGDGTVDGIDEIGTVETFLNMRTAVNNNECTVGEYLSEFDNITSMSEKFSDEEEKQFNLAFGLDADSIKEQYENVHNFLSRNYLNKDIRGMDRDEAYYYKIGVKEYNKQIEDFLDNLSASELSALVNIKAEIDWENASDEDILTQIKKEAEFLEAMNFTIAIDVEAESLEALNTAMAESVSGAGLSSEAIAALKSRYAELESEGYNLSAMFEETANGIHLNRDAVSELEQKLASDKLAETDKQLEVLKNRYDELTAEINECKDAGDRAALYTEKQSVIDKINDLATLASRYEGLTSAYNAWQNAESAGQERDMYESVIEGFENIKDEISRGWIDDGTIKFLELLTGKTGLASKSGKQLKEIYDGLDDTIKNTTYSVRDFFTVDGDGNSTNAGVYNFLDAIGQLEEEKFGGKDIVKRDKDGNIISFDFELAGGDQVIADALGISEELVQIMVRASDDAGFVVNIEGAYTQLADLKTEAELARDTLISLQKNGLEKLKGVDISFDFEAEGKDLVAEQKKAVELLDKFKKKGKVDLTMEGAQQALDIAEYLTIKLDDLTEPKYMQLDASKVEEDIREPLEDMQEFERLSKEKHLLQLTGDVKKIKEVKDDMDEIAQGLEDLDKETKIKLGIDGLTSEEIASKLEKGEIEIPTELKLDVQMSDDLRDIRLLMMDNLGLTSDGEVELKIKYGIDDSTADKIIKDGKQTVVLEYIAKNEEEFNKYTEEEKEAVVKLIADGVDLDNYEAEDKEAIVNYIANGEEADGWTPEAKDAFVKYLADGGEIDKFDPKNKESWVVYDTNTTKPDSYDPKDPTAMVTFEKDSREVDNYDPPNIVRKVIYKIGEVISNVASGGGNKAAQRTGANPDGKGGVNGTANVNGTTGKAFKQGDWRTKKTETALTGEIGREIVVTPQNRWYTVGDSGAEFVNIPRGSIVFNHKQTEELLQNGKAISDGGRARALANGSAFVEGTAFSDGTGGGLGKVIHSVTIDGTSTKPKTTTKTTVSSGSNGIGGGLGNSGKKWESNSGGGGGGSKDKNEFEETIDWIETAIDRIERAIDQLDQKANNVYKAWSERNSALTDEISKVGDEIELQQKAYDRYLQEANSVGLSEDWAEKVRDGKVDIETITDEELKNKIDEYRQWYEKAIDCRDAIEDLKEKESELYAQRFENIQTQYDGILQGYEHTENMLNEYISQAEEQGYIVSKKYYQALINNEKSNIDELKREQADLIAARDEAVESGTIVKGSEAWLEQCAAIDEVTQAIEESATALLEFDNAMRDIDWQIFDLIQERISGVTEEADFLIELMSNKKLFEDDGKLTSQGLATMGLHSQNYNTHMYAADEYGAEVAKLNKQIAEDPYDQELINRRNEMLELQRESILAAEDEKNAIRDMVEEGIEFELDALQELIDKKNEELESEKDLYEYQKKVKKQTSEIASIEKQMAAYSGDDSDEARAKIQELKVSLEEAKSELQEAEMDRYISDQSKILDELYLEYETILNTRLDNIDYLLESVIDSINASTGADGAIASALGSEGAIAIAVSNNATSIKDTLTSETNKVGATLSNAMNSIWNTGDGNAKSVLTMYGEDFKTKSTTIITTLNGIKFSVNSMVASLNKEATAKTNANKTTTSAKKNPTKTNTVKTKKDTTKKSGGDGKPKVGDKVTFVSGQYYYDSQGKKPLGSKYQGKQVYITNINTKDWATHGYHISTGNKLGKGDLGWLKLNQIKGYTVGKNDFLDDEIAWTQEDGKEFIVRPSDGAILTPIAKGDSILTSAASNNIWNMANSPAEFIKDNLGIGDANVPNNSSVQNSCVQHFENITFSLPNVHSYNELLVEMQRDPKFEKLILAMTVDQIAGRSKLNKGKAIR